MRPPILWWIGEVISNLPSAARTALSYLWVPLAVHLGACADEAPVTPPTAPTEQLDDVAPEPEPELPEEQLPAIEADLSVWPLELEAFEILDASFEGDRLLVVTAAADGTSLVRLARDAQGAPVERERRLLAAGQPPVSLATLGDGTRARRVVMWVADGHLHALPLDGELAAATPKVIAQEEGGALDGPLTVATSDDGALACLRDGPHPLCLRLDRDLSPTGLHPFSRRQGEVVRWVGQTGSGWLALFARCRGGDAKENCRASFDALALDHEGAPIGRARALPEIDGGRDVALIGTGEGVVLVGRRRGAGEHSAWNVTPKATMELDGRFSRVVGGFALDDTTLLVERSHLRMRKGFPVSGIDLRPLSFEKRKAFRHERTRRTERERFPDNIAQHLPTEVDQRFIARGDALIFAAPRRKGILRAAVVRISEQARAERPGGT